MTDRPEKRLLTDTDAMVGLTVSGCEGDGGGLLAIHFTDGSAIVLHGYSFYDSPTIEAKASVSDYDARNLGMITDEEYERRKAAREAEERGRVEQMEREQLRRLREKYRDD